VANLQPRLQPGHRIRLLLDNAPTGSAQSNGVFALTNADRGTHTVAAQVVDDDGAVVFTGSSTTFHLQRHSVLNTPPRPSPAGNN
jgi:hypothetical protein